MINTYEQSTKKYVCSLCHSTEFREKFYHEGSAIAECTECSFVARFPQPSDAELNEIYSSEYFIGQDFENEAERSVALEEVDRLKRATAVLSLDKIEAYMGVQSSDRGSLKLLEVGCGLGNFLAEAKSRDYSVTGVEVSADSAEKANAKLGGNYVLNSLIEDAELEPQSYDICAISGVLECTRDPKLFLKFINAALKPGGVIFVAVPDLDSWSFKMLGKNWINFRIEHLFYYNQDSLDSIMVQSGFGNLVFSPDEIILSLNYIFQYFVRFHTPVIAPLAKLAGAMLPEFVRYWKFPIVAYGLSVVATKKQSTEQLAKPKLVTIVIPVYNEISTFKDSFYAVYNKTLKKMEKEIIIVESNSTDGTRDLVKSVEGFDGVTVIFQEQAKGKGNAVREGLKQASGDFILIQDADLEYSVDDYDRLLEPLRSFKSSFVLGVRPRHDPERNTGMRHFVGQKYLAKFLNFGHRLFTFLFNIFYGQRLTDPFTMYKVFRRECIYGLEFEANRFDFDWELAGKLVRRGYLPDEISVHYNSRSFREGKKVTMVADPISWLWACLKFRLVNVERPLPSKFLGSDTPIKRLREGSGSKD